MENRDYSSLLGSPDAPYVSALAGLYGLATRSFGVSHPSLPNYLALLGGSTFGIRSDCTTCSVTAANLVDQLHAAGIDWRAYMEDLPSPCFTGPQAGGYAKKHDPFVYFRDIVGDAKACAHIVPLARLKADMARPKGLGPFVWITPNLCHDGHDCSNTVADAWLAAHVPPLLGALGRGGVLFLTWDEGSGSEGCCNASAAGGHILTIVAGPGAKPRARLSTPVDHYSVLKTIERLYGLKLLGKAACSCTKDLMPLLARN